MAAYVVLNGQLVPWGEAGLPLDDRGALLGDGLFETVLAVDGVPRWWAAHWQRLQCSARALGLPLPLTADEGRAQVQRLLVANGLTRGRAAVRLTLTRGRAARGLWPGDFGPPAWFITAAPYRPPERPFRAWVSRVRRWARSPLARHKTLSALELVLAQREARAQGADLALLCNTFGRLAEAAYANLFVVRGGVLWTPPIAEGALPGVARARVLCLARGRGVPWRVALLPVDALEDAEEVFVTNSLLGAHPVAEVNGRRYPAPGPVTRLVQSWLEEEFSP